MNQRFRSLLVQRDAYQLRPFETEYEVAPGVLVHRTGGHTPGHSVVRLASGGDRLTFAVDAALMQQLGASTMAAGRGL